MTILSIINIDNEFCIQCIHFRTNGSYLVCSAQNIRNFLTETQSPMKESTLEKISDESFIQMEKLCEKTMNATQATGDDLLRDVEVPKLDDTLEEVDFILKLGLQLKSEGKTNFSTPQHDPFQCGPTERCLSVRMNFAAHSSPNDGNLISGVFGRKIEENDDLNDVAQVDDPSSNSEAPEVSELTIQTLHSCPLCPAKYFADSAYGNHLYKKHRADEKCPSFCWLCKCGFAFLNSTAAERHKSSFITRVRGTSPYNKKFSPPMQIKDDDKAHEIILCFYDHVSLQIAMNIYGENKFPFVFLANSSHNSRKTLIF